MDKKYNDEEFDKLIRKSLQQDPTDYDEVTAKLKDKLNDGIEKKKLRFIMRLFSLL